MHRHLYLVRRPAPKQTAVRPAKVVQLDVRRQAKLDALRPQPTRPAA
jgi:hypothetical protein